MIFVTGYRSFLANKFINLNRNINISKMPQIIKKKKIALLYQDKKKLKNYIRKKNIKHLIHFAGCRKQDSEKSKIFAKKSTYIITKNLVDAINDSNKSIVFIYISTDHVFSGLKKRYKENNKADLIPSTNLGFYKLKSEIYIKNNLKKWFIIRSSAVADDPRQTNFILDALKKKKKSRFI